MNKHILIAYVSYFGNCRKIAEAAAHACEAKGASATLFPVMESTELPGSRDALLFICPVRMGNIVKPARSFARKIARDGGPFAIGVSHGAPLDHFFSPVKPAARLCRKMKRRGMEQIGEPVFFMVEGQEGPPAPGWEDKAEQLAAALIES